ncbi:hypothetical protein ONZ51_g10588 [Trametes cubensis]|uniref:Uncharacterized protein n=1 Tax=Trametes cubensis TaxID=1111947 RepID=A0AAD7X764_9APHY|nr:hypothetical protein ONZ51_g10588 [Trametes cubensis]
MLEDSAHWMKTSDDLFYTPVIPVTLINPADDHFFHACGILLRMALFWGQDILPVSPMLIALLLEDFDAAIDKSFLQAVTPDMAARFATWPPRRVPVAGSATGQTMFDVNIREDPMSLILEHVPATQVSHIRVVSEESTDYMTKVIAAAVFFHTNLNEVQECSLNAIYKALRKGLDQQGLQQRQRTRTRSEEEEPPKWSLLQTFEDFSVSRFVAGLCANRRVMSYADVLPLLRKEILVSPMELEYNSALNYEEVSDRWMQAFKRYLSGVGHPDHETFQDEALGRLAESPKGADTLRAELFLRAISDSSYLPKDMEPSADGEEGGIEVRFMTAIPGRGPEDVTSDHLHIFFHTCFTSMDVALNQQMVELLEFVPEDIKITTPFDVYMHAVLLTASGYNTL